jgi:very-short-patch-repair endonuclease
MRRSAAEACADKTSHAPDAENKLWSVLRDRDVAGLRFRHRELVGPYIVDFLCPAAKLILLVEQGAPIDPEQTQWLRQHGYRVLLFSQADVLSDPQRVLDAIAQAFEFRVVSRKN